MATSIDTVTVPVDKLESLLQCSICRDILKDPRTLPCLHSYCKDCLEKFVKNHYGRNSGYNNKNMTCPTCRTTFNLDPEGVGGVPKNHFICNMLDIMAVQNRVKGVPCSHCEESSVGRCVTCELFMCKKCIQSHNNYTGFRNHSVLTMEELSKPENKSKIKGRSHCKKHDPKKLKFYCKTCDETICRRCMDFDHLRPDHECLSLETVAKEKLEALKMNYSTLESKLCEGNAALQELTNAEQSLKVNIKRAKIKINERKREVLTRVERTLERNATCLINEAEALYRNQHSTVVDKMAEVQTYVNKVKASADLSSSLIANGSDEEIVSAQKAVQENVEKVENEYQRYVRTDTRILLDDDKQLDTKFVNDLVKKLQEQDPVQNVALSSERFIHDRLTFDPATGKLRVVRDPDLNNVLCIRMAEIGFVCFDDEVDVVTPFASSDTEN